MTAGATTQVFFERRAVVFHNPQPVGPVPSHEAVVEPADQRTIDGLMGPQPCVLDHLDQLGLFEKGDEVACRGQTVVGGIVPSRQECTIEGGQSRIGSHRPRAAAVRHRRAAA